MTLHPDLTADYAKTNPDSKRTLGKWHTFSLPYGIYFHTLALMTTKHRFRNKYRLEVREDDHPPMHVHLVGGHIDVLIELGTLSCQGTMPRALREEVLTWIAANHDELIQEWNKWHP